MWHQTALSERVCILLTITLRGNFRSMVNFFLQICARLRMLCSIFSHKRLWANHNPQKMDLSGPFKLSFAWWPRQAWFSSLSRDVCSSLSLTYVGRKVQSPVWKGGLSGACVLLWPPACWQQLKGFQLKQSCQCSLCFCARLKKRVLKRAKPVVRN